MKNALEAPVMIEHRITKVNGQIGFKRYKRGRLLGIGAFAKCYQCINVESQKRFAVKVISKKQLDQEQKKQKILSQINIHKTLHHQHIVQFDNAFEDSDYIYIILELCNNDSLLDFMIKKGKFTPKDTRTLILQIIQAVQYMHEIQIIHRDLKLANIFLDQNMHIKVGDFGQATKLEFADQKKISICGTLNYLAPQILSGPFGHSYEVDFWAIGVITFAMLFGKSPFQSKIQQQTLDNIKKCKFQFSNTKVPPEAKDFIKKILVPDPKLRMNLKQMLEHPFLSNSQNQFRKHSKGEKILSFPTEQTLEQSKKDSFLEKLKSRSSLFLKLDNLVHGDGLFKSTRTKIQNQKSLRKQFLSPVSNKAINKSSQNKQHVTDSIDLTTSCGLGYLIGNNMFGIYCNDNTVLSCDKNKKIIYYMKNPKSETVQIDQYTIGNLPKDNEIQKKYAFLDNIMGLLKNGQNQRFLIFNQVQSLSKFIFVKQWWKNSQGTMYTLSNNLFQVSFVDGSFTLFDPSKNSILIKLFNGNMKFFKKIQDSLTSQDSQLKKKSFYTKQIFISIENKKKRINTNQKTPRRR